MNSGRFFSISATVSPGRTPRRCSPAARSRTRARSSVQVSASEPPLVRGGHPPPRLPSHGAQEGGGHRIGIVGFADQIAHGGVSVKD